jgi:predicted Rossmann fold flavoprotein
MSGLQVDRLFDVIIIGAGAAGLMAACQFGRNNRKVLVVDSSNKVGEKIRISGGGRCNFTNLYCDANNYLSENPNFAISALKRFSQHDFIKLIEKYNINYHEKTLGQLFCDQSSKQIIDMLLAECKIGGVEIITECHTTAVFHSDKFSLHTSKGQFYAHSLVIATGGLSIPKIGATDFGYRVAEQFGHRIVGVKPGLVPLLVADDQKDFFAGLSGISIFSEVSFGKMKFKENILFTHRGVSGPAILQISSFLPINQVTSIKLNLLPSTSLEALLIKEKSSNMLLSSFLKDLLPKRFVDKFFELRAYSHLVDKKLSACKDKDLKQLSFYLHNFQINIVGNEGYAKAEVTVGGVDTRELSSQSMMSKLCSNLYFIGEVVDVTGWLGGYNFQWAWSSGYVCGNFTNLKV